MSGKEYSSQPTSRRKALEASFDNGGLQDELDGTPSEDDRYQAYLDAAGSYLSGKLEMAAATFSSLSTVASICVPGSSQKERKGALVIVV